MAVTAGRDVLFAQQRMFAVEGSIEVLDRPLVTAGTQSVVFFPLFGFDPTDLIPVPRLRLLCLLKAGQRLAALSMAGDTLYPLFGVNTRGPGDLRTTASELHPVGNVRLQRMSHAHRKNHANQAQQH